MLELNIKNHTAFEQLQAVYVSVVQEYMKKEGLKVLDKLIDIEVEVDTDTKSFKVKDSGLGSKISYEGILKADKDYDSSYDIFDYYCKAHSLNTIVLPSYFGYDVVGMLGYFTSVTFTLNDGFTAKVDNYKTVDAYLTDSVVPVTEKLDPYIIGNLKFDSLRVLGSLKSLCREFTTSFTLEAKEFGGTLRQHNVKRKLSTTQEDLRDTILMILNDRLSNDVYLFNYIRTPEIKGKYSAKLLARPIKKGEVRTGYVVTLIDGGK